MTASTLPPIEHIQKGQEGGFYIHRDGQKLAELTYKMHDHVMAMEHTIVDKALRGQGVARKLLDTALDYVREHNLKVKPVCSYVQSVFDKSPELQPLLAE